MKKITLLVMLFLLAITGSYAQSASTYGFSSSMGTFTENSGAATTIAGVRADSFLSATQNIGFTFVYEGVNYTQFKMSSNGFISLSTTGTANLNGNDFSTANTTSRPIIAPLWDDLDGATPTTSLASYEVTGSAPNRVLTVEWKNWEWNWNSGATPVISFQVKLYETTNVIEFVYRQESGTVASGSASIGIGSATGSGAGSYLNLTSVTTPAVSSTTSTTTISTKPATGQIFRFTPPTPCAGMPTAGTVTPAVQNICTSATPSSLVATGYTSGVTGLTYQWEESNDNGSTDAWANAVGGSGATTASYTPPVFSGADIYYRLNVTCTLSGMSAQSASVLVSLPVEPATQITAVTIPAATINYSQARVNWTNGSGARRAVFISDVDTFTDPINDTAPALTANAVYSGTGQQLIFDGTGSTVTVSGLLPETEYFIKAYEYVRCGSGPYDYYFNVSTGTNIGSFITCGTLTVPTTENFATFVPGCWQAADNGDTTAGPLTFGSSSWVADGFANSGATGAVKINIDATGDNDWILSPLYFIPATGYELNFNAAATQWNDTAAPTTAWEADDFVEVLVSTDTTNWTVLYTYNNTNVPAASGALNTIYLDDYAGQAVRFAFRGVEGAANGSADIDFFVDNFEIKQSPACITPTGLTATPNSPFTATLNWTASPSAPTNGYEYYYNTSATAPTAGTTPSGSVGAGILTASISSLSADTVYYVWVRSNCGITSDWTTVPVSFRTPCDPPVITSTTPGSVCGQGITTLEAVSSGTIKWYDAATAGTLLGTGSTFTTPNIASTTSYWAEASVLGGTQTSGKTAPAAAATASTSNNWGIVFNATAPVMLQSVSVYSTTAGTINIKVTNAALTELYSTGNIAVAAGGTTTPNVIPLNFNVPAGAGYRILVKASSGIGLIRDNSGVTFPYNGSDGIVNVISSEWGGTTTANYYYFYDVKYSSVCISPRTEVVATVTTPPTLTLSSTNTAAVCSGQSSAPVTVTAGAADYDTFVWSPSTGVTGDATSGWVFNPTTTTAYILTASQSAGSCTTTVNVVVNINPLPMVTASASNATICEGSSTTLTALTEIVAPGTITIGTGTTLTTATTQPTAFCNRWAQYWNQTVFTAAELTAAGLRAGNITSVAYRITTLGDGANVSNFTIRIGTTTNTTLSAFTTTGLSLVYGPATYAHTVGLNTINFATPYVWDGVSNIIVDIRQDGADSLNNAITYYTATAGNTTVSATTSTPSSTTVLSTTNPTATGSTQRLNVVFGGQTVATGAGTIDWLWTPGNLTGNAITVSPTTNTVYTVRGTNPVTGCFTETTVNVNVTSTPAPTGASTQTFAVDNLADATIEDIDVLGTNIVWYPTETDALANTNAIAPGTQLVSGQTYYAIQTDNGCRSLSALAVTVTVTLGNNTFDLNSFKAYPNPVKDVLNLSYSSEISSVEVYNMLGQKVMTKALNVTEGQIDMSNLNAGNYIVKVTADSLTKTLKVIKQ